MSKCFLRAFERLPSILVGLNEEFFKQAFGRHNKNLILNQRIVSKAGADEVITNDRVFLLSCDEAKKYFSSNSLRISSNTDYAIERGSYNQSGNGWWWLRDMGDSLLRASFVNTNGAIDSYGFSITSSNYSVRPAIWVNASA